MQECHPLIIGKKENDHTVYLKFDSRIEAEEKLKDLEAFDVAMHEGHGEQEPGTNYYLVDSSSMGKKYNIGDDLDEEHQE